MCYYAHKSPLQVISALRTAFKIVFAQVVLIFKLFERLTCANARRQPSLIEELSFRCF